MKRIIIIALCICTTSLVLSGCKNKAKEAETTEAEVAAEAQAVSTKYVTDNETSTIEWKGFKPTGTHNGTIKLGSGTLMASDNTIESGSFLIDMGSITVLDIPAEEKGNAKLLGHLKSADFFDVENHANAAFEVTGVSEVEGKTMLSGNLTIKAIKQNITFPVTVSQNEDTLTLTSDSFTIDRSKWDVKYGSKSFFDNLGDKFINDEIELKVSVIGKKA